LKADLLVTNCRIHTLWERLPYAEEMAIAGSRILAVGPDAAQWKGSDTRVLDLDGLTVVPGFIDAHNHLVNYGMEMLRSAALFGCTSIPEIISRLKHHRQRHGSSGWILGHGFDHERLEEGRFPTKEDLDKTFDDTPVMIVRVCKHACVVNSAVLKLIPNRLSEAERTTGILTEKSAVLAWRRIPELTPREMERASLLACEEARSRGITGVHVIIGDAKELAALQALHRDMSLPLRIYAVVPVDMWQDLARLGLSTGSGDEWLRIGPVKFYADGSMGARTAALYEDYSDDPGNRGELIWDSKRLAEEIAKLQNAGFGAAVHAIGDRTTDEVVKGIETALDGRDNRIFRHRIEHAAMTSDACLKKMSELAIPAVVQPQFVLSDFWTIDRVGEERYKKAYRFKSMLKYGITLAMGSDCSVEVMDPFQLVFRAAARDKRSMEESLSPLEALKAYCMGSSYASFEEKIKGSLEPGKLADFAVLSHDILDIDIPEIETVRTLHTCVGGKFYPEITR
jgi:predicted amidohydrolase YtcJ